MKKHENFRSQLAVLCKAGDEDLQNEFIVSGIINKYALQFELSWKLLKETLAYEGIALAGSGSPREVLKAAFAVYDFIDEAVWLEMLKARNDLAHIYDGEAARAMVECIIQVFVPAFTQLERGLDELYEDVLFSS